MSTRPTAVPVEAEDVFDLADAFQGHGGRQVVALLSVALSAQPCSSTRNLSASPASRSSPNRIASRRHRTESGRRFSCRASPRRVLWFPTLPTR
eukprot:CAMPEP_0118890622 /NCGR_PEP_ID=MMETSP1166-20130328/999_1 /TAXON_ID=1104430 /ORGANISM="Chrysoreinhardia sp, Strain CCMP3193" /LENGTH=93 /DNA_ID=CAMNT_0006829241 /DNA_START=329 /DNA_END=606 /DNA_ORIENTATION=+